MTTLKQGIVYLVGAGPGDPGLLTVKGLECIRRADVLVYDRLASPALLAEARPDCEKIYVGKEGGRHAMKQEEINLLLAEQAAAGKVVCRLKGGDPFVFGRGGEEAEVLAARGIPFQVVPGVTAGIAAAAYAGIPVTHRNVATSVALITGHEDPTKPESQLDWARLAGAYGTLVFYMGMENLEEICRQLMAHGRAPETPAAVIRWGTRPEQQTVAATLATLVEAARAARMGPPAIIIVGEVVALRERLQWFETAPLFGQTVLVTRARAQASGLAERVRELGGRAWEFPAIEIQDPADWAPVDRAIARLGEYEWLVLTSQNGVERFMGRLYRSGRDARALAGLRLVAVGPATAAALRRHGLAADFVPPEFRASAVLDGLQAALRPGARVLVARAEVAATELARDLRALGAAADEVVVYRSVPAAGDAGALKAALAEGAIQYVTFASAATVRNLVEAVGAEALAGVKVAVIGPQTAAAARAAGLTVHLTAAEATIAALVDAIAADAMAMKGRC